ncbi:MAG: tetratricopeptide repeat protein [candidate division Zixibacteria bacterium]|nr:tetratricopeptide repeat protein [candidate division Zixibacteria bacterium]NIW39910.1 tetratricopeptide repeat protein [candidate division Zixibacteria bacterium]NIX59058.1 tetratricopeptide repeat protein [candidate division Zixibacteria bacterium]
MAEIKASLPDIDPDYQNELMYHSDLLHAEALLADGAPKKAVQCWENVPSLEMPTIYPWHLLFYNVPFTKDILARACIQKGDLDRAIAEYERLTTFDPNSKDRRLIYPPYHYKLAKLYEQKDWPEKAMERYEKFLSIWKDADEDLPELIDARARLARLPGE